MFSSSQFVFISVSFGVNSSAFVAFHQSRQPAEIFYIKCFTNSIRFIQELKKSHRLHCLEKKSLSDIKLPT